MYKSIYQNREKTQLVINGPISALIYDHKENLNFMEGNNDDSNFEKSINSRNKRNTDVNQSYHIDSSYIINRWDDSNIIRSQTLLQLIKEVNLN